MKHVQPSDKQLKRAARYAQEGLGYFSVILLNGFFLNTLCITMLEDVILLE